MKILYIADLNGPIARNWIRYFVRPGNEIQVITWKRAPEGGVPGVRVHTVPFLGSFLFGLSTTQMSHARTRAHRAGVGRVIASNLLVSLNRKFRLQRIWQTYLAPLEVMRNRARVRQIANAFQPDLVHALRIPPEGYVPTLLLGPPAIVSVWGNAFTDYGTSRWARHWMRAALERAGGLHADCARDIRLAHAFGYPAAGATLVVPAAGGISDHAVDPAAAAAWRQRLDLAPNAPVVINPRGTRTYVRLEEFYAAVPRILRQHPNTVFVCPASAGNPIVTPLVRKWGIEKSVRLLPVVAQSELAELFHISDVMVSPTDHDGTPGTLLEAMAQGAFPVASDLESIREWITPGENGLLFDPRDSDALAAAVTAALDNPDLRRTARVVNKERIRRDADYETCMQKALDFYHLVHSARVI